jgi:uncharacterized repeat protein (TIGR01451 family)
MGTVTPNTGSYDGGSEVTVTATANPGYKLVGWDFSQESAGSENVYAPNNDEIKVLMKGDNLNKSVTAVFESDAYTIEASVSKADNGDDMGSISASPASDTYGNGQVVTLTATPAGNGYVFHHWDFTQEYYSGDDKVYNDSNIFNSKITLTMRGEYTTKSVKAVFEQIKYSVDANAACEGADGKLVVTDEAGTVTPPRGEWYSLLKEVFDFDLTLVPKVTITAIANDGYEFDRWHYTQEKFLHIFDVYEENSDGTITVRMMGSKVAKKVTAVFAPIPNDAPVAFNKSYDVNEGTTLTVSVGDGVLKDATDANGDTLTASVVGTATNGVLNLASNGSFTYTPNAGFVGEDTFTFVANDGKLNSAAATVKINVLRVNVPPVALDKSYDTNEGTTLTVSVGDGVLKDATDANGDTLTASVVGTTANGDLDLKQDGSFTYTPNAGFDGIDTFTYLVKDGEANSNTATVSITVLPARGKFNLTSMQWISATEHTYRVRNQSSFDITYTWEQYGGTDNDSGSVPKGQDGTFTGHGGTIILKVYIDGKFMYDYTKATNTVIGYNTPPEASNQFYATAKNTVLTVDADNGALNGATDIDGQKLTAGLETGPFNGTVELNTDGSFTYTPDKDFVGEDEFEFYVSDGVASVTAFAYIKVGLPAVAITKTVNKPNAYAGNSVKYTVTVTNTGDTGLTDVIVYDDLLEKSWLLDDLEPEGVITFDYNYTIPANTPVNETITNTATVYANERNDDQLELRSLTVLEGDMLDEADGIDGNLADGEEYGGDFGLEESASATVTVIEKTNDRPSNPTRSTDDVTYTLTMAVDGEGTVSPGTGSNYSSGTTVQLSATPAEGWEFEGWQGDVVNASNQIIMNSNKSVTAVFTKIITLEDEPTPEATASEPEITELDDEEAPAAPADVTELPKTGGMPAGIFYGLGGLIAALGAMLRRKTIR